MFSVPLYILAVRYLSEYPDVLMSEYLFALVIVTMIGSIFPDVDIWIYAKTGLAHHRNVLTHSVLLPAISFFVLDYFELLSIPIVVQVFQAFLIGVASHLIADNIKTGGNITGIPKKWENWWYTASGIMTIIFLYFTSFFTISLT